MTAPLRLLPFLMLAGGAAWGHAPGFLSDPVVTHTNGMRLASSTSTRSHNVYWQCEAGRHGYCDGRLHSPCRDSWRALGTRCHGRFLPPPTPMQPAGTRTAHAMDGLELADSESLGPMVVARAHPPLTPDQPSPPADFAAPGTSTDGDWMNALQTIGRKMMSTPED